MGPEPPPPNPISPGPMDVGGFMQYLPDPGTDLAGAGGANQVKSPIEMLGPPNTKRHKDLLDHLNDLLRMSQNEMNKFYTRWRFAERQYQAFMLSKDIESLKKASNERGTAPETFTIVVPYSYASIQTIVTYLIQTFCGRKPMYQVGSYRSDTVERAKNLETILQYNVDHARLIRKYIQFFLDGEKYGLCVMRNLWSVKGGTRTQWKPTNVASFVGNLGPAVQQTREDRIIFEGNEIWNIDPFQFFPDPRVPMEEVNEKGEFVFWRTFEGQFALKKAEAQGLLAYVDLIPDKSGWGRENQSMRQTLAGGEENPGRSFTYGGTAKQAIQLDQGSVEIIPSKWGLGTGDKYEKWLFTIANEGAIVQAEPLDLDHDRHPVIVGEPYSDGYGFGNAGISDYLSPMQDTMTWLINSHMFNVRAALNNSLVVNPQMVDMNDLAKPGPGRIIKLKPAAFGQDPKNAVYQLAVQDITRSHIPDMAAIQRLGDAISSVNDNLRGVQDSGGRKTATEVRTAGEAGASRLASHARMVSSQSMSPHAEMMAINYQQNMSMEVYLEIVGPDQAKQALMISPDGIAGDFYYPVSDGTLPLDRVAMMDVWKEILMMIMKDPMLRMQYDAPAIFEYVAELGGAKNLTQFKMQAMPDQQLAMMQQAGNVVPMGGKGGGGGPPGPPGGGGALNAV